MKQMCKSVNRHLLWYKHLHLPRRYTMLNYNLVHWRQGRVRGCHGGRRWGISQFNLYHYWISLLLTHNLTMSLLLMQVKMCPNAFVLQKVQQSFTAVFSVKHFGQIYLLNGERAV